MDDSNAGHLVDQWSQGPWPLNQQSLTTTLKSKHKGCSYNRHVPMWWFLLWSKQALLYYSRTSIFSSMRHSSISYTQNTAHRLKENYHSLPTFKWMQHPVSGDVWDISSDSNELTTSWGHYWTRQPLPSTCYVTRPWGWESQVTSPTLKDFTVWSGADRSVRPRWWSTQGEGLPQLGEKNWG